MMRPCCLPHAPILLVLLLAAPAAHAQSTPPAPADSPVELEDSPAPGDDEELTAPLQELGPTTQDRPRPSRTAKPAPATPIPTLWDSGVRQLLVFTAITAAAGLPGALVGSLVGALLSGVIAIPAALLVKSGTLSHSQSTLGIYTFLVATPLMAAVGGTLGWLVGRTVGASMSRPDISTVPRWKVFAAFTVVDALAHLVVGGPLLVMALAFGGIMAAAATSQSFYMPGFYFPARFELIVATTLAYALVVGAVLWPAGLTLLAITVPAAALVVPRMAQGGGGE